MIAQFGVHSSEIGRFLSEDPLGFAAGDPNLYAYVGNNPLIYNDPSGKVLPLPLITAAVGGVAGIVGSTAGQLIANRGFDNFSVADVAIAGGVGFVAGAAAPYTAVTYVGAIATGSVANAVQYGISQAVKGQNLEVTGIVVSALTGGVGGAIGGPVARTSKALFDESSPWLEASLARQLNVSADAAANTAAGTIARNVLGSIASSVDAMAATLGYPSQPKLDTASSVYAK